MGLAVKQYSFLGFRLVPGAAAGAEQSTAVYEDHGGNTDYLEGTAHVWTTCNVTTAAAAADSSAPAGSVILTATIKSTPSGPTPYAAFPTTRNYQLRLPNGAPPSTVTVTVGTGGMGAAAAAAATPVPFTRFGMVLSSKAAPPAHQWYYSFQEDQGVGPVIDLVGIPTDQPVSITITTDGAAAAAMANASQAGGGLFGTLIRAVYAHGNMDVDRSNPDSNSPGPAYLSQLSAVGVGLEHMADPATDPTVFAAAVANVPTLLASTIAELQKGKSSRIPYTLDLLNF